MVAGVFVHGGGATLLEPAPRAEAAASLLAALRRALPFLPPDLNLVRLNAGVQVVAGGALALGIRQRLAAIVLTLSLVPTTLAGHPFWEISDPKERGMELIQCGKNLGVMGGLLLLTRGDAGS
jgi:uncharacterized membrane protein YphA (DoxX/SURF4 family)